MPLVACLHPEPTLADPARARGIALVPLAQAPQAAVRLARWSRGDGCVARRLGAARRGHDAARAMLLVDDGDAVAAALDAGADDAATLHASPAEIVARLAALLRGPGDAMRLTIGDLTIDRVSQTVARAGIPVRLLPREYAVLLCLADHAGTAVPRDALLRRVWARGFDPGTNVVQVQVSRLRARLDAAGPPMLHTDRGHGYRLGDALGAARSR